MKLSDFLTAMEAEASKRNKLSGEIAANIAARVFRVNFEPPCDTRLSFSSHSRTKAPRQKYIKMAVALTTAHPYFRPWIKAQMLRASQPICIFDWNDCTLQLCGADTELERIVDALENSIIERVKLFYQHLQTLNALSNRCGLQDKDYCDILNAIEFLSNQSTCDKEYFLHVDHRNRLLSGSEQIAMAQMQEKI